METMTHSHSHSHSHCWWFQSYNTSNSSPWLQSTLSELNEKTKTMLKLIEEDADSFAQRAEMYYKKRPELINMVEDFYRTHRSLAQRYDQLKSDRAIRIRSPLRQTLSLPKVEFEYILDSGKSIDSFNEPAYSSEAAESEVDDPEEGDRYQIDRDESEIAKPSFGGASYDELLKLRDELHRLRDENEILNNIIRQTEEQKVEFVTRLSDNTNGLSEFRVEMGAIQEDMFVVSVKETSNKVSVPFDEDTKLTDEIEKLKMENLYQKEHAMNKAEEVVKVMKMFEGAKFELMRLEQELETINGYFMNALAVKDERILEITRQFEETKSELAKLRNVTRRENVHLNLVGKYEDRKVVLRHLKEANVVRNDENCEPIWKIINAPSANDLENKTIKLKDKISKDEDKNVTIRRLRDAIMKKDIEKKEVIRQLNNALVEKDEEKREAIRQLSIAMEILREESKCLKKTLVSISPRKKTANFQILKGVNLGGVNLGKLFS